MNSNMRLQCIEEQDSEHWDLSLVPGRIQESKRSIIHGDTNSNYNTQVLNQISQNVQISPNGFHNPYRFNDFNNQKQPFLPKRNASQKSIGQQEEYSHLKDSKFFLDENSIDATFLNFINTTKEDYQYNAINSGRSKPPLQSAFGSNGSQQMTQNNRKLEQFSFSSLQNQPHLQMNNIQQTQNKSKQMNTLYQEQFQTTINQMNDLQNLLVSSVNNQPEIVATTSTPLELDKPMINPTYSQIMKKYSSVIGDSTTPTNDSSKHPINPTQSYSTKPIHQILNKQPFDSTCLTNSIIPNKQIIQPVLSGQELSSSEYTHSYRPDSGRKLPVQPLQHQKDIPLSDFSGTRDANFINLRENQVPISQKYDDVMKKYLQSTSTMQKDPVRVNYFEEQNFKRRTSINQSIASSTERSRGNRDNSRESRTPIATSKELLQNFSSISSPNQKFQFGNHSFSSNQIDTSQRPTHSSNLTSTNNLLLGSTLPKSSDVSVACFTNNFQKNNLTDNSQKIRETSTCSKPPLTSEKSLEIGDYSMFQQFKPILQAELSSNTTLNQTKPIQFPFQGFQAKENLISPIVTPSRGRIISNNTSDYNQILRNVGSEPSNQPSFDIPPSSSRLQQLKEMIHENPQIKGEQQEFNRSTTPVSRNTYVSPQTRPKIFNTRPNTQQINQTSRPIFKTPPTQLAIVNDQNLPNSIEVNKNEQKPATQLLQVHDLEHLSIISDNGLSLVKTKSNNGESILTNGISFFNQLPFESTNMMKDMIRNIKSDESDLDKSNSFNYVSRKLPFTQAAKPITSFLPAQNKVEEHQPFISQKATTTSAQHKEIVDMKDGISNKEGIPIRCVDCERFYSQNMIENHICKDLKPDIVEDQEEMINIQLGEIHRKLLEVPSVPSQVNYRNQILEIISRLKEKEISTTGLLRDSRSLFSLNQNILIHPDPDSLSIHILSQRAEVLSKTKIDLRLKNQTNPKQNLNLNSENTQFLSNYSERSSRPIQPKINPTQIDKSLPYNKIDTHESIIGRSTFQNLNFGSDQKQIPKRDNLKVNDISLPLIETKRENAIELYENEESRRRNMREIKSDLNVSVGQIENNKQKPVLTNLFAERLTQKGIGSESQRSVRDSSRKNNQGSSYQNIFPPLQSSASQKNLNSIQGQHVPMQVRQNIVDTSQENNISHTSNNALMQQNVQDKSNLSSRRMVFYGKALSIKLKLPVGHPGCSVDIQNLFNIALNQNVLEQNYSEFIDSYFNKLK